jgi:uncharacterized protein YjdB
METNSSGVGEDNDHDVEYDDNVDDADGAEVLDDGFTSFENPLALRYSALKVGLHEAAQKQRTSSNMSGSSFGDNPGASSSRIASRSKTLSVLQDQKKMRNRTTEGEVLLVVLGTELKCQAAVTTSLLLLLLLLLKLKRVA